MEKCITFLQKHIQEQSIDETPKSSGPGESSPKRQILIVYGAFGGRMDQTLASIHVLIKV